MEYSRILKTGISKRISKDTLHAYVSNITDVKLNLLLSKNMYFEQYSHSVHLKNFPVIMNVTKKSVDHSCT